MVHQAGLPSTALSGRVEHAKPEEKPDRFKSVTQTVSTGMAETFHLGACAWVKILTVECLISIE